MASHFGSTRGMVRSTPAEWLPVCAQVSALVNEWAGRDDLIAYLGEDGGQGIAPAMFTPATLEIEVNTGIAFGKTPPYLVGDLRERHVQFDNAKASGAIFHEALHAKFTTWDLKAASEALTEPETRAMHVLEESRIEGLGVLTSPGNRAFLRSCALEIVLGDMSDEEIKNLSTTRQVAHLSALTLARVDAGVLEQSDVFAVETQIRSVMDPAILSQLRAIWTEFQSLHYPGTQLDRMYELAREWNRIVQEEAEAKGEGKEESEGSGSGSGAGSPDSEGSGSGSVMGAIMEALAEDAEVTEDAAGGEAQDTKTQEEWEKQASKRAGGAAERKSHEDKAAKVFGKGSGPLNAATNSTLRESRPATPQERAAAVRMAKQLEKAKYRDRDKTVVGSVVPPGRLRTRGAVQGAALRSKGIQTPVEPWRRSMHKQTDEPTLKIGVMVDISGSMYEAMEPMATTAWVLSEAVKRVQGKTAMVYYGNDVFPTLAPGQHLDEVKVYTAEDGTERFNEAFVALDGALNLLQGNGARLLIVCSDGNYGGTGEQAAVAKWLARCQRAGVGVLWVSYPTCYDSHAQSYCAASEATFFRASKNVTDVSDRIGKLAADALTNAGKNRQR